MPLRAEVAKAEDALAIGDDDELGRIRPVGQQFGDVSAIVGVMNMPRGRWKIRPKRWQARPTVGV